MSRGGRLLAGAMLAGFGIALALGVVEGAVRVLHLVPTRFWEPDPLLGTRLVPGKEGWWTQEEHEFLVPVHINAQGRRDIDRPREKPPGTMRVLLLGDSFIEAMHVPLEQTLARQLEARLNRPGAPPVEVISLGVSGYGTASELLYYRDIGRQYAPDLVLLAFYPGNDVRNNSPTLEPTLRPAYDAAGNLERVSARRAGSTNGRSRGWLGSSAAYTYFRRLIVTRQPGLAERLAAWGLFDRSAVRPVPMRDGVPVDYWVYAADPPEGWAEAWSHTEHLLGQFRDLVEADGGRFMVMIATAREQIYPADWERVMATYPAMQRVEWDLNGPERRVLTWCERAGVPCLRLSLAFVAARDRSPRLHFEYDGHWTPAGHALAADTVETFLREAPTPARHVEGL